VSGSGGIISRSLTGGGFLPSPRGIRRRIHSGKEGRNVCATHAPRLRRKGEARQSSELHEKKEGKKVCLDRHHPPHPARAG
jgi:hypothetical protein